MRNVKKRLEKAAKHTISKHRKVLFKNFQSPGDLVMLSAAIRDLKLSYPDIEIGVDISCKEIFENNPHITKLNEAEKDVEVYTLEYPLIHNSNEGAYHFIHGFKQNMEEQLGLKIGPTKIVDGDKGKKWRIPCGKFKGDIHISDEEKGWISQIEELGITEKFWILNAGGKSDFNCKLWSPYYYQEVVDHFKNKITFVQVGESGHFHPPLKNVINLIGKTDLRQLIRLVYHSIGIISGVSLLMHLSAATECKHGLLNRPGIIIAGGREPLQWEAYPNHRYASSNGCMDCCNNGGCWKSRVNVENDGDNKDKNEEMCIYPVEIDYDYKGSKMNISKCMYLIKPKQVISAIEMYYDGGILEYNNPQNRSRYINKKVK